LDGRDAAQAYEHRKASANDIAIAQACVPLPISTVAVELGLAREDYDEHGRSKAKARAPHLRASRSAAVRGATLASQLRTTAPRLRRR
jgi:hypothetical protein